MPGSENSSSGDNHRALGAVVLYRALIGCHITCIALHAAMQRNLLMSQPRAAGSSGELIQVALSPQREGELPSSGKQQQATVR